MSAATQWCSEHGRQPAGRIDGFDRAMQAAKADRDRKVIHANFGDDAADEGPMTAPPIALMLAGPNGAGKTTVASDLSALTSSS